MNARWVESRAIFALLIASLSSGCHTTAFYTQVVSGHLALMQARRPIEEVIASPDTSPELRSKLARIDEILEHGTTILRLDAGERFRTYADIHRDYVVWNLFVAPELATRPYRWCYPIIGCAAYRGYFAERAAQEEGMRMRARGFDVSVLGSAAYSSLGWFDDPVISTFATWDTAFVAGLVFHELAHSKLFIKDDTAFNESFATFVEREGLRSWLAHDTEQLAQFERAWRADDASRALLLSWRKRLDEMYGLPLSEFAHRHLKAQMLRSMMTCFASLPDELASQRLARMTTNAPSNATFVPVAQYFGWLPAFTALFRQSGADWQRFYDAASAIGDLEPTPRRTTLAALAPEGEQSWDPCVPFEHRFVEARS